MPAKSFLRLVAGKFTEILGTQASAGAANAGDIPALNDAGRIDVTMLPTGVGPQVVTATATEGLLAGSWVELFAVGPVNSVRLADGSTNRREAIGFVLEAVPLAGTATIYMSGQNTARTGLTLGADYWLSDTAPGGQTATAPAGAGKISQLLGRAISTTTIQFNRQPAVTLAT